MLHALRPHLLCAHLRRIHGPVLFAKTVATSTGDAGAMDSGLVSAEWLSAELEGSPADLRVLDASWFMPNVSRDPAKEFLDRRLPGAAFFDIEAVSDKSTGNAHMMSDASMFAQAMADLGVGPV